MMVDVFRILSTALAVEALLVAMQIIPKVRLA